MQDRRSKLWFYMMEVEFDEAETCDGADKQEFVILFLLNSLFFYLFLLILSCQQRHLLTELLHSHI